MFGIFFKVLRKQEIWSHCLKDRNFSIAESHGIQYKRIYDTEEESHAVPLGRMTVQ